MVFERFTRSARAAVTLAQEEAKKLGDDEIGSQHVLLGLMRAADDDLVAVLRGYGLTADVVRARLGATTAGDSFDEDAEALRVIGIDLNAVRDSVARTFGPDAYDQALRKSGRRRRRRGHTPFTHATKKALELSLREALAHKDKQIRCEHVLLGILRGGDNAAAGLITEHVSIAQLRAAVNALLDKAA
ncbi:Clp protease N-terminal domain-containing protein [Mycobacterium shimoidei]|uniref:ATPase AAA-2 domain-containing protein [Jonesia denitrificans DSM] n=1 Tax=Mycobacterium shimoidei TaxID=29313 RepID=A0A1E3TDS4_MYCSH|nr:Clp protease N-terminal domain-containing protein [Mycobacterium shimoidei]MCV7260481.1 Clp protease [Mycobacterium shimoidei]ODR12514.1 Clp protease [Mycobacterium shimoidei]ORW80822.1 Clp protease [Mycobacterium shimoidei]SRX92216.1 ATPase AAA-2 domain-containing protein [Jonesia denitrificans DSM] [Mycobacterium shimoidei]